jgi:AcrR family transcriptional regulator
MNMDGFKKRTERKKQSIINAARELFTERGITDVKVSEIAAKAHVSQVSIYNYFGDKNGLVREVLITYLNNAMKEYEEILERDIPFSDKLKMIIEKKHDKILEATHSEFSQYALEDKALRQIFMEMATHKSVHIYTKFIELGKKEGAIDAEIPNDVILTYIFSIVSIIQQPNFSKASSKDKKWLFKLFLYGLLGKEN